MFKIQLDLLETKWAPLEPFTVLTFFRCGFFVLKSQNDKLTKLIRKLAFEMKSKYKYTQIFSRKMRSKIFKWDCIS